MSNNDSFRNTHNRLLAQALATPAEERDAFLDDACDGDLGLRKELKALVEAAMADDDFLAPAGALRGHFGNSLDYKAVGPIPERVGQFRIVREIGRGGMSVVYLAERDVGDFNQQVAIKIIRPGENSDEVIRRFAQERRILASLNHPGIAHLYDGGWTEDGRPYFTMELIEGWSIIDHCRQYDLDIEQRLDLFMAAADAVGYAHAHQIVHRDLKPSNILVDDRGQVRLLDFGIAKLLDVSGEDSNPLTRLQNTPLTPEYASPEQVLGRPVTSASDVYQLGVLLYELLTDRTPYRLISHNPQALASAICDQIPTRPSMMSTLPDIVQTEERSTGNSRRWFRRMRGDLDTITMMALRKEPKRRYASAKELTEDIRRYLSGRPITARKDAIGYRMRKFIGRHVAAAITAAVAAGIVSILSWQLLHPDVRSDSVPLQNSVAVLPFRTLGGGAFEFLGDGIANELINGLAAIPQLRVVSRSSSFSFRGTDEDIMEVGEMLGVSAIVDGSVEQVGDRLQIAAQIVDVSSGDPLWSETFEQDSSELLFVQQRIAEDIVGVLAQKAGVTLPKPGGPSSATNNAEAYELYMLGQQNYLKRGDGVRKSIELFQRATELDPSFAHAWAGLSTAYSSSLSWGGAPDNVEELVAISASRAIELDENLGSAYMALGGIEARKGNYAEGAAYLYKALAVAPNDPTVLTWSYEAMLDMGRSRDALQFAQRLHEINPVMTTSSYAVGWANLTLGNLEVAERFCDSVYDPKSYPLARCSLILRLERGDFDAASALLQQIRGPDVESGPGDLYFDARRGPSPENTQLAIDAIDVAVETRQLSSNLAFYWYATLGDLDSAFNTHNDLLDRGRWFDTALWWLPSMSSFRQDPRFVPLAERAGLVDFWRAHGWADACRDQGDGVFCE